MKLFLNVLISLKYYYKCQTVLQSFAHPSTQQSYKEYYFQMFNSYMVTIQDTHVNSGRPFTLQ